MFFSLQNRLSNDSLGLLMPALIGQLPESVSFVGSPFCSASPHHASNASSIFVAQVGRKETHKYRASIHARLCVGDACQLSHSVFNKAQPASVVGRHCSSCLADEQGGGGGGAQRGCKGCSRVHSPNLLLLVGNPQLLLMTAGVCFRTDPQHPGCPTVQSQGKDGRKDIVADLGS